MSYVVFRRVVLVWVKAHQWGAIQSRETFLTGDQNLINRFYLPSSDAYEFDSFTAVCIVSSEVPRKV